jgi:hypothetical protein
VIRCIQQENRGITVHAARHELVKEKKTKVVFASTCGPIVRSSEERAKDTKFEASIKPFIEHFHGRETVAFLLRNVITKNVDQKPTGRVYEVYNNLE